jgi:acetyl esterase
MTAFRTVRRSLFTLIAILPVTALFQPLLEAQAPAALTPAQIFQKLDPRMADVVRLFDAIKGTPIIDLTPQDARQQFSTQDAAKILARGIGAAEAPMPVGKVQDGLTIDGPDGNQIPIRMYTPAGSGPFPVILYFHGGGFVTPARFCR